MIFIIFRAIYSFSQLLRDAQYYRRLHLLTVILLLPHVTTIRDLAVYARAQISVTV
jgi:hypothetical protein